MKITYIYLLISLSLLFFDIALFAQNDNQADKSPCLSCEELKDLRLPDVMISKTMISEEQTNFCQILGTIGKEINFELLLPSPWNGRFAMGGGGGFVGSIQNMARTSVHEGYATVGTDTGHKANGLKADWALDNMERQVNFGHLAVHRTAEVAKSIIYYYYCEDPSFSYFIGCSRGGGQAMMEAQRYPEDFDGIVSAAPAFDWPAIGAEFIQNIQAVFPDPGQIQQGIITPENIKILQERILGQCDELDGVRDNILNDPRDCDFDFSLLSKCKNDVAGKDCFTTKQIKAIKTVYEGIANKDGRIYPGFPLGGENEPGGWKAWITGPNPGTMQLNFPSLHYGFGTEMFKYLVFQDPDWNYENYDFSNLSKETRYAASYLNATATDYSIFKNRGGKMIMYHGWNDPALSAFATIEHYTKAEKEDPQLSNYVRLFLLPGVLHCGGGPGPSQADWLQMIREWVEKDVAPSRVIVSKMEGDSVVMTRPVFPYPRKAIYDGKGDPSKASSFH